MYIDNNKLYFAGDFSAVNGFARGRGAAIDLSTYALESFNPMFSGGVNDLDKDGNNLFFTGDFYSAFTAPHKGIVEYDPITGIAPPWSLTGNNEIWLNATVFSSGKMIVAGTVDGLTPIALNTIAIFDSLASPYINITASQTNITGCETVNLTSNSFPLNYTGLNNQIEWYVNGSPMGVNDTTVTYYPADGDEIICVQTFLGNDCYSSATDTSNIIIMNIDTRPATINISALPVVSLGDIVTVDAVVGNVGTSYSIDWSNNGSLFNTTTAPQVTYVKGTGADVITATITSLDCNTIGLSNTIIVNEPVNILNKGKGTAVSISPNPFKNTLNIVGLEIGDNITLINTLGQIVEEMKVTNVTGLKIIELRPGSQGLYSIKVTDKSGKTKATGLLQRQ